MKKHDINATEKECSKCKTIKLMACFGAEKRVHDGRSSTCIICENKRRLLSSKLNPERRKEICKNYRVNNSNKIKEINKIWQQNNPESGRKASKKFATTHPEKIKNIRANVYIKRRKSNKVRLNDSLSCGIYHSLKNNKQGKTWKKLVDFTLDQLKIHLEKQFLPGMSWDNYGKWHIDHRIPISAFNFERPEDIDFKQCWALRNLRPLWAIDNIRKLNKLEKPFQPSLAIAIGELLCCRL